MIITLKNHVETILFTHTLEQPADFNKNKSKRDCNCFQLFKFFKLFVQKNNDIINTQIANSQ